MTRHTLGGAIALGDVVPPTTHDTIIALIVIFAVVISGVIYERRRQMKTITEHRQTFELNGGKTITIAVSAHKATITLETPSSGYGRGETPANSVEADLSRDDLRILGHRIAEILKAAGEPKPGAPMSEDCIAAMGGK